MHNIKEAIYENKSKLEGIGEDYKIQVGASPFLFRDSNQPYFKKHKHDADTLKPLSTSC